MKRLLAFIVFFFAGVADAQTVQNTFGIQWNANNTMAVSTVGNARVRYNSVTNVLEVSYAGAAYAALGGGTLQQAYNAGGVGPQTITFDATRLGFVLVDANPTIGATLFAVRNNAQTIQYIKLNTIAGTNNMAFTTPSPTTNTGMIFNTVNDYTGAIAPPYVWNNVGNNLARLLVNSATQTEYDLFAGNSGTVQTQLITDTATTGLQVLVGSMPTNTTGVNLTANVVDGASSTNVVINGTTTLASGKLLAIQDAGTEKFNFMKAAGFASNPTLTMAGGGSIVGSAGPVYVGFAGARAMIFDNGGFYPSGDLTDPFGLSNRRFTGVFSSKFYGGSVAPPASSALGTNVTSITCTGNDAWGTCSIVTGGATTANQSFGTISFNVAYGSIPVMVLITPAGQTAATTANAQWYLGTIAAASFQIKNVSSLGAGTYVINYQVGG